MEVTQIGFVILAAATWSFFFAPRYLYAALVISIPFSATAVINFSWGSEGYGQATKDIMAWQLFAVLWILRQTISGIPVWRQRGWFLTRNARLWLLTFLAAMAASLTVPLLLHGTAWAPSWENSIVYRGPTDIPLRFSLFNATQSAYMIFGVLLAIFIAAENCHPDKLLHTLQLYVSSCVFAAAWGLFELVCNITGYAYAANIFNTGKNISSLGYTETLGTGSLAAIGRVSSVATEPSTLAEELLLSLVVLIVCMGFRRPILRRSWNWFAVMLIGVVLLASTSSTAYGGMLAAMLLSAMALARAGSGRWKQFAVVTTVLAAGASLLVTLVPLVNKIFQAAIMLKYINGSGHTRVESVQVALQSFLRHPLLGVGWGNASCWDLVILILANMGLVGLVALAGFLIPVLRKLWRLTATRSLSAAILFPALALALILAEGDGLSYGIGYFWFVFGLAAGVSTLKNRTIIRTEKVVPALCPIS